MIPKMLGPLKIGLEPSSVKFWHAGRLGCFHTLDHEMFDLIEELMSSRRDLLEEVFARTYRQPASENSGDHEPQQSAHENRRVEQSKHDLENAARQLPLQVEPKQNSREKTQVEVNLQPSCGTSERQKGELLPHIVQRQSHYRDQQQPARGQSRLQKGCRSEGLGKQQHRDQRKQKKEISPAPDGSFFYWSSHAAKDATSPMSIRANAS